VQPPTEDDLQAKDLIDQPKDNSDIARRTFIAILSQARNMTLREYLCSIPFALFSPLGQDIFQIGYESDWRRSAGFLDRATGRVWAGRSATLLGS
jgi:hypothetical protein